MDCGGGVPGGGGTGALSRSLVTHLIFPTQDNTFESQKMVNYGSLYKVSNANGIYEFPLCFTTAANQGDSSVV